jgi:antitoxin component YwqK of YwqJK toxin-antitoxin module
MKLQIKMHTIKKYYSLIRIIMVSIILISTTQNLLSQTVIQMSKFNGVSVIPCKVNGLSLNFIYDTGASDVSLSLIEAGFMLKNGYLTETDFVGSQNYIDANGNIVEGVIINLRTIIISGLVLKDVKATIVKNTKAPLLLGQSALSRLGIVQQDFSKNTITIFNTGAILTELSKSNTAVDDNNKIERVITEADGTVTKFSIMPLNRILTKQVSNIEYFWYNQESNSIISTIGEWGGPLLNAKYQKFYSNGNLAETGFFINGVRNGEFKFWYDNGQFNYSISYQNDQKKAISKRYNRTIYDVDGNQILSGYKVVKTNPKVESDIIVTYYNENNSIYRKEVGYWPKKVIEYWPNGKERRHFTLHSGTQTRIGEYIEYFENGAIRIKGNYNKNYPLHTPIGVWRVYKIDGTVKYSITFSKDTLKYGDTVIIGNTISYNKNKNKQIIGEFQIKINNNSEDIWETIVDKFWNPENEINYEYPRYIAPYLVSYLGNDRINMNMCFKLDDYSIEYYPHDFEID